MEWSHAEDGPRWSRAQVVAVAILACVTGCVVDPASGDGVPPGMDARIEACDACARPDHDTARGAPEAGSADAAAPDARSTHAEAGPDAAAFDAGGDADASDARATDRGAPDAALVDAALVDAALVDAALVDAQIDLAVEPDATPRDLSLEPDGRPQDAAPDAADAAPLPQVCCAQPDGPAFVRLDECPHDRLRLDDDCADHPTVCCAEPFGARWRDVAACAVPLPADACADEPVVCCLRGAAAERLPASTCARLGLPAAADLCLPADTVCCLGDDDRVAPAPADACPLPVEAGACFGDRVCCERAGDLTFALRRTCEAPHAARDCRPPETVCCTDPDGVALRVPPEACAPPRVAGLDPACDDEHVCCDTRDGLRYVPAAECAAPLSLLRCSPLPVCCALANGVTRDTRASECEGQVTDDAACEPPRQCCAVPGGGLARGDHPACFAAHGVVVDGALCAPGVHCCAGAEGPAPSADCADPLPPDACPGPVWCCLDGDRPVRDPDCAAPVADALCAAPDLVCCDTGLLGGGAQVVQARHCPAPVPILTGEDARRCGDPPMVCCDAGVELDGVRTLWLASRACLQHVEGQIVDPEACR